MWGGGGENLDKVAWGGNSLTCFCVQAQVLGLGAGAGLNSDLFLCAGLGVGAYNFNPSLVFVCRLRCWSLLF